MNRKSRVLPLLALTAGILAACSPHSNTAPPAAPASDHLTLTPEQRARLKITTVHPTSFHHTVETTGTVGFDADRSTTILAPISGPVTRVMVSLGATVHAGEPLAMVASPDYAAAVSGYRKAAATAANLRRIADLNVKLFAADAIARRDVEQSQVDAANAEADREAALQQLRSLGFTEEAIRQLQAGRKTVAITGYIRSPLEGTVVEKLIGPGQLLQAGTTACFTVADLRQMWIATNVFESDLASVAVGDPAEIFTGASDKPVPGRVDNISAILDPNTRAVAVRVVADNPSGILKKDMYVQVRIRSRRATTGLLAPVGAILRDDENLPFVYLAQAGGDFARRHVTLGSRDGDDYEIAAGLKDGDQLVVDGGLYMQFQQNQ
jgi:cobalt-zinc-cadmium efflux system membrane fusion protein